MSDLDNAQAGASVAPVENTPASAEQTQAPSESTTETVETQQQEQPRDEQGRFVQKRINELTRARREAERERDFYRQQAEQFSRQQPQQHAHSEQDKAPSLADYKSVEEWGAAVASHAAKAALSQAEQRFAQHDQQRQQDSLRQTFEQKEAAFAATNADYYERVSEMASVVQFQPEVLEVLATSDHGPAVAHYLANHLDEADALSRMSPHVAAAQIARLEGRLSAPKPAKPVSNAPEPAPKVGGAAAAPRGLSDDLSTEEWMRRRMAKS